MRRMVYLAVAALVALLILAPAALGAQEEDTVAGDDDPYLPEPNAIEVDTQTLQQIAGQPLPETGGLAIDTYVLLPAALLLGSGVLSYAVVRRRKK